MSDDIAKQLAALRSAFEIGALPEGAYNAAVSALVQQVGLTVEVGGSGAVALAGGIAAGAGGVAAGKIDGDVNITQQIVDPSATDPASLRRAYLSYVFERSRALSLAGVDPKAASEAEARLNLGAVYTALLTQTPERDDMLERAAAPRETRRLSAVEQMNSHRHLVLLGDPGSGKSTFVNFVALCMAGEALGDQRANLALLTAPLPPEDDDRSREKEEPAPQPWRHGALLPVRVVLRDFAASDLPQVGQPASAEHLWKFIDTGLVPASLPDYAPHLRKELRERGGILLLDGLDEVPEADQRRTQIRQAVEDFKASFPRVRILVTSRTYAYQNQDWRLPGFQETVLAPFTPGQVRSFVDRWYAHIGELRHLDPQDAQGRAEVLKRAISASDRLQALAERPLLLTLMASLHAWRGGSLPEKREELYADAVDLLLDWWESQRVVRDAQGNVLVIQPSLAEWLKVDRVKVRDLLNALAFAAHASQPDLVGTADIPEKDLVDGLLKISQNPDVKPRRLVEYLRDRAGLLLPHGVGVYTFPHRTFQEYLAACYLTDHDYPEQLAELARRDPNRWREVVLLAGAKASRGTASAVWSLVDALCYQECDAAGSTLDDAWGAHLAGQALVETADLSAITPRNQAKVDRVRRGLLRVMRGSDLPAIERAGAGRDLAVLGDPRPEVMTVEGMQFCLVPAGPFWMGDGNEQHLYEGLDYDYWIGRFPVTNAQYRAFVDAGGYRKTGYWPEAKEEGFWRGGKFKGRWDIIDRIGPVEFNPPFDLKNHPVVGVSWYEALAFARWLTKFARGQGRLTPDWQVSLPSEPQWEKAARGGIDVLEQPVYRSIDQLAVSTVGPLARNSDPKRAYPWGPKIDPDRCNYSATEIGTTSAAGCFGDGTSVYGAEEMSGNVWEWTRSLWGDNVLKPSFDYPYTPTDGRENLNVGPAVPRILRGARSGTLSTTCAAPTAAGISLTAGAATSGFGLLRALHSLPWRGSTSEDQRC